MYTEEISRLREAQVPLRTPERIFTEAIFLGNGEFSDREVVRLHRRLEAGVEELAGLQQTPRDDPQYQEGLARLRTIVADIQCALLGGQT